MGNHGHRAGMVVGQRGGATKGHLGAEGFGDLGDLIVVGRDDDAVEDTRNLGHGDRMPDHRPPGKESNVLARDALAATAGGDDGESHQASTF